ncbi:hypothetical protein [uncultured Shewanella sp.]|uniref:hypothetical protein n=1 Tax=uncultured Shewanella sp. TaxID=173975 RepID=UPI00261ED56C|nr:hypothetical protein [uncultured Shewanella sp.]
MKSQSGQSQNCSQQFKTFPAIHAGQMALQRLAEASAQKPAAAIYLNKPNQSK